MRRLVGLGGFGGTFSRFRTKFITGHGVMPSKTAWRAGFWPGLGAVLGAQGFRDTASRLRRACRVSPPASRPWQKDLKLLTSKKSHELTLSSLGS